MRESLTQRAYLKWRQYWLEEPWGPWRDNLHTAMICRELRRPQVTAGTPVRLDDFMVKRPAVQLAEAENNLWNFLSLIARKNVVSKKE